MDLRVVVVWKEDIDGLSELPPVEVSDLATAVGVAGAASQHPICKARVAPQDQASPVHLLPSCPCGILHHPHPHRIASRQLTIDHTPSEAVSPISRHIAPPPVRASYSALPFASSTSPPPF